MKILVTGGAGYIGSTICSALLDSGHTPIILDSLITGCPEYTKNRIFYHGDIADGHLVRKIFSDHPEIRLTIHCAALISVPESVKRPYEYYKENVAKSIELFRHLIDADCPRLVFSSSASLYDAVPGFMVNEKTPLNPGSPYARSKLMIEIVLRDFCKAYGMKGISLRYFNPIGADPQMRSGIYSDSTLVLPTLMDAAMGKNTVFRITGTNWPTRDGSGIRDYIHVWDLALAHVSAAEKFDKVLRQTDEDYPYLVINLGTGKGVTVRELVAAFEKALGINIHKVEAPPRPGDVAGAYANADLAWKLLGWRAKMSIEQGIKDALKWGEIRKTLLKAGIREVRT
ncbi:MAG: UDP-glucose 4-epimerase GalE [Bacillota bacterium]